MSFNDYVQYKIRVSNGTEIALEERQEIIISQISDMPFESFEQEENLIFAYVPINNDLPDTVDYIKTLDGVNEVERTIIKGENWNKIWEESFEPITINNQVIVRAPFHLVENNYTHEIIIEPKMSFGTGHHSTTRLMMEKMLHLHFKQKSVLDMGCGTGILAILAHKLGAVGITAIDNDPVCIESTIENCQMNGCPQAEVFLNDKISANFKTDIILANIQRNVLLEQMPLYSAWLNNQGSLLVSGIYEESVKDIVDSAKKHGLKYVEHNTLNNWCMIRFDN